LPPDGDVSADRRQRQYDALLDLLAIDPEAELGAALDAAARLVAVLVAEGLTNDEIAQRLVVVPGTIGNHIEHILRKLGLTRRVQIATWSLQLGLWPPAPLE
jgi:DNA-binding NarL/FixJ family response regulator